MTRISFDLRFAHLPGGGGVYTAQLARALVRNFPDIQWRFYTHSFSQPLNELIRQIRFENNIDNSSDRIQLRPVRSEVLSLKQHLELFRTQDDACLYHYPHFDMPIGIRGPAKIVTIHDLYPLTMPGYCNFAKRCYFRHITQRSLRIANHVITISQQSQNDILTHFNIPKNKITIIPQGYAREFHPIKDGEQLERIRQKYTLPQQFIYYSGNLKPHKNLLRFLQAYARLSNEHRQHFPFILSGSTVGQEKVLSEIERLDLTDHVRLLGLLAESDLPAMYNLASLYVLPSFYEGFGLGPLEAMACGTAVICSSAPALPDVVGDAARLFDPLSIDDMKSTLQTALENDIDNPDVRQTVLDRAAQFSWDRTAQYTCQIYRNLSRHKH